MAKRESRIVVAASCSRASIALVFRGTSRVEKAFAVFGSFSELAGLVENSSVFEEINYCLEASGDGFCSRLGLPETVVGGLEARLMAWMAESYCRELARYAGFRLKNA